MKKMLCILISASVLTLTACSSSPTSSMPTEPDMSQSPECLQNPFLQKYNCSLDQVEQSAEQGEPDAEYALGYMYYYGIFAPQDQDTALLWIKRAAEQAQPLAIKALGMLQKKNTHHVSKKSADTVVSTDVSNADRDSEVQPVGIPVIPHQVKEKAHVVSTAAALPAGKEALLRIPESHYTIQLMADDNTALIKKFVAANHLEHSTHLYEMQRDQKPFFVLIYGDYPDIAAAKAAEENLPAKLKAQKPWVKSFKVVHEQLK